MHRPLSHFINSIVGGCILAFLWAAVGKAQGNNGGATLLTTPPAGPTGSGIVAPVDTLVPVQEDFGPRKGYFTASLGAAHLDTRAAFFQSFEHGVGLTARLYYGLLAKLQAGASLSVLALDAYKNGPYDKPGAFARLYALAGGLQYVGWQKGLFKLLIGAELGYSYFQYNNSSGQPPQQQHHLVLLKPELGLLVAFSPAVSLSANPSLQLYLPGPAGAGVWYGLGLGVGLQYSFKPVHKS